MYQIIGTYFCGSKLLWYDTIQLLHYIVVWTLYGEWQAVHDCYAVRNLMHDVTRGFELDNIRVPLIT